MRRLRLAGLASTPMTLTAGGIGLYAITSALAVLATADLEAWKRLVAAVGATGLAVAIAFALRGVVSALVSLSVVALVVGASRGAVLVWVLSRLGDPGPNGMRIASSMISALIWLVAIAAVLRGREGYRRQYAAAVQQIADAQAGQRLASLPEVTRMQATLDAVARSAGSAPDETALRAAAQVLRDEVEQGIRPLSHRIWFSAGTSEPHARILPLVRDAVTTLPVPIVPVLAVWTLSALVGAPTLYGAGRGIVSVLLSALVLAVMLMLTRRVLHRWRDARLGSVLLVACAVVPVLLTDLALGPWSGASGRPATAATFVLAPLAIGALVLAAAATALAAADREEILRIAEARADEVLASQEVSAYLHNSLQSQLSALALQLDRAEPGSADAQVAVERLAALASRSIADDFHAQRELPIDRMQEGARAWHGIADVTVVVADDVEPTHPRLMLAVQAVEEITSNAIRHGSASRVVVEVRQTEGDLVIEAASDGVVANGSSGMGSAWLADVSRREPAWEQRASGTVLRIRL